MRCDLGVVPKALPRVVLFSLGGTIAMGLGEHGGMVPRLHAQDLVAAVPGLDQIACLEAESVLQVPSVDLRFSDVAGLADRIRSALAAGVEGVVVTQGTDTLEEAAFLLDLLLEPRAPVVVTGALRGPASPGADGLANLLSAVRVAVTPAAAELGVLVVMNEEIHAARFVRKMHTHRTSAFASPALGPLGWVVEDRVRLLVRPLSATPTLPWRGEPPCVSVIPMGFATDHTGVDSCVRHPPVGAVVAGMGSGHVPSCIAEALGALAARIPVVLTSRIGIGEGHHRTYGFPGSEMDLLKRGLLPGGFLDPAKARILLSLLLADGADRCRIEEAFAWS